MLYLVRGAPSATTVVESTRISQLLRQKEAKDGREVTDERRSKESKQEEETRTYREQGRERKRERMK